MNYNPLIRSGACSVNWTPLASNDERLKPLLVALLYGRILIVHEETTQDLMNLVGEISIQNVRTQGKHGFNFPDWAPDFGLGVGIQNIWPWAIIDDDCGAEAVTYKATLKSSPPRFFIHLDMAFGLERILAPASTLIAINAYANNTDQEGVFELAIILWLVTEYYRSLGRTPLGSESDALLHAMEKMRSGDIQMP